MTQHKDEDSLAAQIVNGLGPLVQEKMNITVQIPIFTVIS